MLLRQAKIHKPVWVMWGILALAYMIVFFHRVSIAVILDKLIVDFEIEKATLAGYLAGMYALIYTIMQIPSGLLSDFWGPRKTVSTGLFVAFGGSVIFALSPMLVFAFIGRGLIGLGVSVVVVSVLKFHASWFEESRFATMIGLAAIAGNLGASLGTSPMALLVTTFGWRNSFLIIGFATLVVAILCWLIVRDTPETNFGDNIENDSRVSDYRKTKKEVKIKPKDVVTAFKNVIKNSYTWPLFISFFGAYGVLIAFSGTWSILYLTQMYNYSRSEAANFMLAVTVGMVIGSPLICYISDKLGKRKEPHLAFFALHILLWALLLFWNGGKPPEIFLYPIFFFMGFSSMTVMLILTMAKEVNELAYAGTAIGVVNVGPFAGMAIMQPLMGYILDLRWEGNISMGVKVYPIEAYRLLFLTNLIILLVCFGFALRIKETKCQNI